MKEFRRRQSCCLAEHLKSDIPTEEDHDSVTFCRDESEQEHVFAPAVVAFERRLAQR